MKLKKTQVQSQKGKKEAKSSAAEDAETSSRVTGADQSVGYIIKFANTVELHQKKNQNCFGVW